MVIVYLKEREKNIRGLFLQVHLGEYISPPTLQASLWSAGFAVTWLRVIQLPPRGPAALSPHASEGTLL